MTDNSLLTKYRPQTWKDVIGQGPVVKSLSTAIERKSSHAYLLVGPSGTGKTTLARIAAKVLGCTSIEEVDAATHTGVDDMRGVAEGLMYRPIGPDAVKVIIIDESHMLSKSAWNSLLKILEHPPDWVTWFLCTTEANKVPATVKTRCLAYELKPVSFAALQDLLDGVAAAEKLEVSGDVIDLCAKEAQGSPRQALANLGVCATAKSKKEAAELLKSADGSTAAFELAQALYRGADWGELVEIVAGLGEINPESVRHVIRAYGTKVVLNPKNSEPESALAVLSAFSQPFNSGDGITPILIACGKLALS